MGVDNNHSFLNTLIFYIHRPNNIDGQVSCVLFGGYVTCADAAADHLMLCNGRQRQQTNWKQSESLGFNPTFVSISSVSTYRNTFPTENPYI